MIQKKDIEILQHIDDLTPSYVTGQQIVQCGWGRRIDKMCRHDLMCSYGEDVGPRFYRLTQAGKAVLKAYEMDQDT